jgi:hypothetical protein
MSNLDKSTMAKAEIEDVFIEEKTLNDAGLTPMSPSLAVLSSQNL